MHQYAKNALVLVPLLTAHKFTLASAATSLLAVVAVLALRVGRYILNDLLDIKADRAHPTKRNRPIASGVIPASQAVGAMGLVLAVAFAIAISISIAFGGVLLGYFVLTTSYSFWLKRIATVDVVVLATLYTVRVIGGAVAISVPISEWLLAFSLFIFMSLALVKRYIELASQPDGAVLGRARLSGRRQVDGRDPRGRFGLQRRRDLHALHLVRYGSRALQLIRNCSGSAVRS